MDRKVGFASFQLPHPPAVDGDIPGIRGRIVPEVFDELQLLREAEVEDRFALPIYVVAFVPPLSTIPRPSGDARASTNGLSARPDGREGGVKGV